MYIPASSAMLEKKTAVSPYDVADGPGPAWSTVRDTSKQASKRPAESTDNLPVDLDAASQIPAHRESELNKLLRIGCDFLTSEHSKLEIVQFLLVAVTVLARQAQELLVYIVEVVLSVPIVDIAIDNGAGAHAI